jgi:hypothetical protein
VFPTHSHLPVRVAQCQKFNYRSCKWNLIMPTIHAADVMRPESIWYFKVILCLVHAQPTFVLVCFSVCAHEWKHSLTPTSIIYVYNVHIHRAHYVYGIKSTAAFALSLVCTSFCIVRFGLRAEWTALNEWMSSPQDESWKCDYSIGNGNPRRVTVEAPQDFCIWQIWYVSTRKIKAILLHYIKMISLDSRPASSSCFFFKYKVYFLCS